MFYSDKLEVFSMRKLLAALGTLVLVCSMVLLSCAEYWNPDAVGSITVSFGSQGSPVTGGNLVLYRVAEVVRDDADLKFSYLPAFSGCSQSLEDVTSTRLTAELSNIVLQKKPTPDATAQNTDGKIVFENLPTGLYLLMQTTPAQGYYVINPFLVTIPITVDGEYRYDVEASSKMALEPEETTTPPPPTWPGSDIPQTGQLKWPVPVLAAAGLALLSLGMVLRRKERDA